MTYSPIPIISVHDALWLQAISPVASGFYTLYPYPILPAPQLFCYELPLAFFFLSHTFQLSRLPPAPPHPAYSLRSPAPTRLHARKRKPPPPPLA